VEVAKKHGCGWWKFFFQCLVQLELTFNDHNPWRLCHKHVETTLYARKERLFFFLVQRECDQRRLARVGHSKHHQDGSFESIDRESLVDENDIWVLEVSLFHFLAGVVKELQVAFLQIVIVLEAVIWIFL
jgi:hypothetical protein